MSLWLLSLLSFLPEMGHKILKQKVLYIYLWKPYSYLRKQRNSKKNPIEPLQILQLIPIISKFSHFYNIV